MSTGPGTVTDTAGTVHAMDVLVVAVGQAPLSRLAEQTGLLVRGGIAVDAHGRTSLPGVWVAGDVAAFPDLTGAVTIDRTSDMRALRRLIVDAPGTPLALLADEGVDLAQVA